MARANSRGCHLSSPISPPSPTYSISPPYTPPPCPFYEFSPRDKLISPCYKSTSPFYKPPPPPPYPFCDFSPWCKPTSRFYKPTSPRYKPTSRFYKPTSPRYKPSYPPYYVYDSSAPFARKRKKRSNSGGRKELGKNDVSVGEEEVECLLSSFDGEEQLRQAMKSLVMRDVKALGYVRKEAEACRAAALQEILGNAVVVERAYLNEDRQWKAVVAFPS